MVEFRPEHERMLWSLPATGSAFKKVYYDPNLGRQVSIFIPAEDIICRTAQQRWILATASRTSCARPRTRSSSFSKQAFTATLSCLTPKDPSDIQKAKDKETGFSDMNDDRYTLYECHVDLDLEGLKTKKMGEPTGIMLPYVVTLIKGTNDVLSFAATGRKMTHSNSSASTLCTTNISRVLELTASGFSILSEALLNPLPSLMRQLIDAGTLLTCPVDSRLAACASREMTRPSHPENSET
jgi:hypothetical protein